LKSFVQSQSTLAKAAVIPSVRYVPGVVPVVVFMFGAVMWGMAVFVLASIGTNSRAGADMWFAGKLISGLLFLMGLPLIVASFFSMRLPRPSAPERAVKNFFRAIGRRRYAVAAELISPLAWSPQLRPSADLSLASPADFDNYWRTTAQEKDLRGVARLTHTRTHFMDEVIAVVVASIFFDRSTTLYVPALGSVNIRHGSTICVTKLVVKHGANWFLLGPQLISKDERELEQCMKVGDWASI
jgi:hypothetical protein